MSNDENTELLQRVADSIDRWEGTPIPRMLEYALKHNDLEGIRSILADIDYTERMSGNEPDLPTQFDLAMTPERADAMWFERFVNPEVNEPLNLEESKNVPF